MYEWENNMNLLNIIAKQERWHLIQMNLGNVSTLLVVFNGPGQVICTQE